MVRICDIYYILSQNEVYVSGIIPWQTNLGVMVVIYV